MFSFLCVILFISLSLFIRSLPDKEGDGPAHVLPEEAELKMDDEAEHRLRPPSAMVEQQPSSFSSLDEEIWKSEQGVYHD